MSTDAPIRILSAANNPRGGTRIRLPLPLGRHRQCGRDVRQIVLVVEVSVFAHLGGYLDFALTGSVLVVHGRLAFAFGRLLDGRVVVILQGSALIVLQGGHLRGDLSRSISKGLSMALVVFFVCGSDHVIVLALFRGSEVGDVSTGSHARQSQRSFNAGLRVGKVFVFMRLHRKCASKLVHHIVDLVQA